MFEKHLSFQLKYARESYAKSRVLIKLKLDSEVERAEQRSQRKHANEMILIWKKALDDYDRLAAGNGTKEELETFKMFFVVEPINFTKKKVKGKTYFYYSSEETPQTKLFSFD